MQRFDYRDLIGGLFMVAVGLYVALHAHANYPIGQLQRMGPGYLPVVLGYMLAGFGLLIVLPALLRPVRDDGEPFAVRVFVAVLAAMAVFALTLERFGLAPATMLLVVIAALAEPGVRPVRTGLLAVGLAALGCIIFIYGLGVPIPVFAWGN